jgi:SLT domain-containing protein
MIPAAAGAAANFMQGYGGTMMSNAVQGATIGQMLGPAFGVNPRSLYVIPQGTLSQGAGDYAQANYYAMMNMGVAPGTQNWSTVQRGANQMMTLVPGMSRQGAMGAMNQLQQPGVLNRAYALGISLRPGGQLQTPEQQYQQIFNRLTMGGNVNAKTFAAMMQPGAPGAVNLEAIGIEPGTDAYYGFMQYAYTRLGQKAKGANMPDVGTSKGAKQAGLDTPYYAQLQAQSAKSQLESRAEPGIAEAAKNLNQAAAALLHAATPLGSLLGGAIGGAGKMFGGLFSPIGKMLSLFTGSGGGMFQAGGLVPGPLNEAMLAIVHGGERIVSPGMLGGGMMGGGGLGGMLGGLNPLSMMMAPMKMLGGLMGGVKDLLGGLFHTLFSGLGGGGGGGGGILGGIHRGLGFGKDILKDIPGLGELFGGSVFGAAGGMVHGAMHKAGGLFHSITHGIGSAVHGLGHLAGDIGGAFGKGKDFISSILMGKLTDIPDTALHSLLSPTPAGSVLAAMTAKVPDTKQPQPQPGQQPKTQQKAQGPKQAAEPPSHKHHRGGLLGGIEGFIGGAVQGDITLGKDFASAFTQFFGGTPAAAATMTNAGNGGNGKAKGAYGWNYRTSSIGPIDLSGMFATQKGSSPTSNNTSGSGGTGASGTSGGGDSTPVGTPPTGNLASWIAKAMQLAGVSGQDWTNGLNLIIQHESGGNPNATNNWDSNAAAGHPSQGLMQEIPSTFQSNALPGYNSNILDPVSNIAAGIRYINSRYGGIANVPGVKAVAKGGSYVGYARGTQLVARTQLAMLHAGEAVVPAADNYSATPYNKNGSGGGGAGTINLNFKQGSIILQVPPTSSQKDMENMANQFVQAISKPQVLAAVRST